MGKSKNIKDSVIPFSVQWLYCYLPYEGACKLSYLILTKFICKTYTIVDRINNGSAWIHASVPKCVCSPWHRLNAVTQSNTEKLSGSAIYTVCITLSMAQVPAPWGHSALCDRVENACSYSSTFKAW